MATKRQLLTCWAFCASCDSLSPTTCLAQNRMPSGFLCLKIVRYWEERGGGDHKVFHASYLVEKTKLLKTYLGCIYGHVYVGLNSIALAPPCQKELVKNKRCKTKQGNHVVTKSIGHNNVAHMQT